MANSGFTAVTLFSPISDTILEATSGVTVLRSVYMWCCCCPPDLYIHAEYKTLLEDNMYVKLDNREITTVKTLANVNTIPHMYYEKIGKCKKGRYLPKDDKGIILP